MYVQTHRNKHNAATYMITDTVMWVCTQEHSQEALDPPKMELQAAVSHWSRVLGTELGSLQEQYMLLIPEPSLQLYLSPLFIFCFSMEFCLSNLVLNWLCRPGISWSFYFPTSVSRVAASTHFLIRDWHSPCYEYQGSLNPFSLPQDRMERHVLSGQQLCTMMLSV